MVRLDLTIQTERRKLAVQKISRNNSSDLGQNANVNCKNEELRRTGAPIWMKFGQNNVDIERKWQYDFQPIAISGLEMVTIGSKFLDTRHLVDQYAILERDEAH